VATALAEPRPRPVLVALGSGSFHETSAHLAYLIELLRRSEAAEQTSVVLVPRADRYPDFGESLDPALFWSAFDRARAPVPPATLWVDGVGLRPSDYRRRTAVTSAQGTRISCALAPREAARPGDYDVRDGVWRLPHRLYDCGADLAAAP
jgi:hypothetical protein